MSFDSPLRSTDDTGDGSSPEAMPRLPLEHAFALDCICRQLDVGTRVYAVTDSATLLQGVLNRHHTLLVHDTALEGTQTHAAHDINSITGVEDVAGHAVDHVLVLEPGSVALLARLLETMQTAQPHDCLIANPYSFNRITDRAVTDWLAPSRAREVYEMQSFETDLVGYHGPRSIVRSILGRAWQAVGRPDKRDVYTYRMRATYRESHPSLASLSNLVHLSAVPAEGDA